MKWLNRLSLISLSILGFNTIRNFLQKYEVLIFDKEDLENEEDVLNPLDLRGTPTHVCVCGSNQFLVRTIFDNYEIATYFLDMICASCGNLLTAPTPVDREEMGQ